MSSGVEILLSFSAMIEALEKTSVERESSSVVHVDADDDRSPRSRIEMAEESAILRPLFKEFSLPLPPAS